MHGVQCINSFRAYPETKPCCLQLRRHYQEGMISVHSSSSNRSACVSDGCQSVLRSCWTDASLCSMLLPAAKGATAPVPVPRIQPDLRRLLPHIRPRLLCGELPEAQCAPGTACYRTRTQAEMPHLQHTLLHGSLGSSLGRHCVVPHKLFGAMLHRRLTPHA